MSRGFRRFSVPILGVFVCLLLSLSAFGTSVIPITDSALYERADLVIYGHVVSTGTVEGLQGDPETITRIQPLEVMKGGLPGQLVLHQAGGSLPDGRFFKLWGRPEYTVGQEVVVFAISRPEGGFQTAEMLLGKFEVWQDESGERFAVPDLSKGAEGVSIRRTARKFETDTNRFQMRELDSLDAPRQLVAFVDYLRNGARSPFVNEVAPRGTFRPVMRKDPLTPETPDWANLSGLLRYNNGGTSGWTLLGVANITGGGVGEATRALATWNNEPNSTINHTIGGTNPINLSAISSPCGWSTCMTGGGVIGCGGPRGGGSPHTWRSETYGTITGGEVWLRCYATPNLFGSTTTESVILHELGHAMGLGHSDQAASSHDVCRGDEGAAIMRSSVQSRSTLGTDDQDAVRWLYGDGNNSCSSPPPPPCTPVTVSVQPTSRTITRRQSTTMTVTATGTAPFTYQWYTGASGNTSAPVSGATGASLTTSPTATTSYWARLTNSCGSANSLAATVTVNAPPPAVGVKGDMNGDGRVDLLWREAGGATHLWLMNGVSYNGSVVLPSVASEWRLEGAADFTGDGKTDLVWRNYRTGETHLWVMNGTTYVSSIVLATVPVSWHIEAAGDFTGDGKADLVWRNYSTGENHIHVMNGTSYLSSVVLGSVPVEWKIEGAGDLSGDGKLDLVWRNYRTGENHLHVMNGTSYVGSVVLPGVGDVNWRIEAVNDYNGDGRPDMMWRHYGVGANNIWLMNGTSFSASVGLHSVPTSWEVAGPR